MDQVNLYTFENNAPSISVYLLYSSQKRESKVNIIVTYPQHNNNLFKEYWLNKQIIFKEQLILCHTSSRK